MLNLTLAWVVQAILADQGFGTLDASQLFQHAMQLSAGSNVCIFLLIDSLLIKLE
jgi:hypothetical protein